MKFTKQGIAEFKCKRSYLTWRKNLKRRRIFDYLYSDDPNRSLENLYPGKDIQYCHCYMYHIVTGDYQLGIKYVNENGTFYMFLAANSRWAPPQDVAVGKAMNGQVYLIREHLPYGSNHVNFRVISEEYITKNEKGFCPKSYNHSVHISQFRLAKAEEEITDEDVKCAKIAYEGVRAFSKLIDEAAF